MQYLYCKLIFFNNKKIVKQYFKNKKTKSSINIFYRKIIERDVVYCFKINIDKNIILFN